MNFTCGFATFALLTLTLLCGLPAQAQRLLFQRGDTLYSAEETGADPRPLLSLGASDAMWAASPDGRRIAWMTRAKPSANSVTVTGLLSRPATVRVADVTGRRQKKLISTDNLRDRQNQKVTVLAVFATENAPEATQAGVPDEWEPVSLGWSGDSRTVYIGCYHVPSLGMKATFALDGSAGAPLVDGEGRWKALAPLTYVAAQGGLLVGSGTAKTGTGDADTKYAPLVAVNLFEKTRTVLFKPQAGAGELPAYAFATQPALAPQNRAIVLVAEKQGLWLTDKFGKSYRRIVEGDVRTPHFSADGTRVFFLLPRPLSGDKPQLDIYSVTIPTEPNDSPGPPTLVLQSVAGFDVVPQ
jgi:hypothetical protein